MDMEIGLQLNREKSEVICANHDTSWPHAPSDFLLGAHIVDPTKAMLLGSPIGDVSSISSTLKAKTNMLQRTGDRLPVSLHT